MENNIQFREIKSSDYEALEKIIGDTWDYNDFGSPKIVSAMEKVYLSNFIANQTFTCVAINNGEPVGIIMGKNNKEHHSSVHHTWRTIGAMLTLLLSGEGREALKAHKGYDELNKALFGERQQKFDGELLFFIVRGDQCGTGIGNELFDRFLNYMKSQSIDNYYVYTDSACNYGFYEHKGLKRIGDKKHSTEKFRGKDLHFFLYASN